MVINNEVTKVVGKVGWITIHKNPDSPNHPYAYWLSAPAGPYPTVYIDLDAAQRAAHKILVEPHCRCTDPFCTSTSHPF